MPRPLYFDIIPPDAIRPSLGQTHLGIGNRPLRECANDQGNAIADEHTLDEDAGVVAPGENREAKCKADRIGLI